MDDERDRDQHRDDQRQGDDGPDQPSGREHHEHAEGPDVIATTDPVIAEGIGRRDAWRRDPGATVVTETNEVEGAAPAYLLPTAAPSKGRRPEGGDKAKAGETSKGRSGEGDRDRDDHDRDREKPRHSPMRGTLMNAAVALVVGMIGAGVIVYFFGPSKSKDDSSAGGQADAQKKGGEGQKGGSAKKSGKGSGGQGAESGGMTQSASDIPGFTSAEDADAFKKQLEHLDERLDQLSQRMDTMGKPRNETPPDLRTLQIKVGDLSRSLEDVGTLPSRFRRLESRLEDFQQEMKTLRDRVSSSKDDEAIGAAEKKAASPPSRPLSVITTPRTVEARPDSAMAEGVALFSDGKYAEALNVFRKLQATRPDDAVVWYYSALSAGLTTGDWTRAARELAAKGVERERAGTPASTTIDAAFAGLTDAQGRQWLNSLRSPLVAP